MFSPKHEVGVFNGGARNIIEPERKFYCKFVCDIIYINNHTSK